MADNQNDYKVGRRCIPVSKRGSPATPAAESIEAAGAEET
jgi:hypothetical protein